MVFENLRIKDVDMVLHYRTNLKRWRTANRKNHIIGIHTCGEAYHDFGYKNFVLSRNCIFFFNQRDDYRVEVIDPGEAFVVHFTTYEDVDTESFCVPLDNPGEVMSLLGRAERAYNMPGGEELALMSAVYALCGEMSRIRQKAYFAKDKRMFAAKSYIDMHFREDGCLAGAVSKSGLTARRFNDLFKLNFDTTPNRYIIDRRIKFAKEMLEAASLSISEIAQLCGFSDVYYFSKIFKKETGVSPSNWK